MKAYKLSVPILIQNFMKTNREETLRALKHCGAERVFIGMPGYFAKEENRNRLFGNLSEKVSWLKQSGFEVGAWILSSVVCDSAEFQYKWNARGEAMKPWCCHADEALIRLAETHVRILAGSGVSLIMFDDDFHHSHYDFGKNGLRGCSCPAHRALMREMYGSDVDFNHVMEEASADKPNESRRIWMSVMAAALEKYAIRVRAAVDAVDPAIRMGVASCVANHGIEGSSLEKLSAILAGRNRPFTRLIGAPYWYDNAYGGRRDLNHIIEIERWEAARYRNSGIETMGEGDVFPRPRTAVPAAILEALDTAMRVDGKLEGMLKYMIPYYSHAEYDTGYVDRHCENKSMYEEISRCFSGKDSVGIRIYTNDRIFTEYDLAYKFIDSAHEYKDTFVFQQASRVFSRLSLPTTYDGISVSSAVFGEYGRFVEKEVLAQGTILDLGAALALTERGIDVGLRENCGPFAARGEDFGGNELHRIMRSSGIYRVRVDEKAQVLSRFVSRLPYFEDELPEIEGVPAAYLYENADGQRFCVLAFATQALWDGVSNGFSSYAKSRQLAMAAQWVSKKTLPALSLGNPKLYLMCKTDGENLAVGLWNFSEDKIATPVVQLSEEFFSAEYIHCIGRLEGKAAVLSELAPFAFCGILLKGRRSQKTVVS